MCARAHSERVDEQRRGGTRSARWKQRPCIRTIEEGEPDAVFENDHFGLFGGGSDRNGRLHADRNEYRTIEFGPLRRGCRRRRTSRDGRRAVHSIRSRRVPTDSMEAWGRALGVEPAAFARRLLSFYDPEMHRLLFEVKK